MKLNECHMINFPKIADARGNLTVIESSQLIPFAIQRVFYLYDVPVKSGRAGHAHKKLYQLLVAISGSFDVILNDGYITQRFHLNQPYQGLLICPMVWGEVNNFSSGSVCLVLASLPYDESDYYRNYDVFQKEVLQ